MTAPYLIYMNRRHEKKLAGSKYIAWTFFFCLLTPLGALLWTSKSLYEFEASGQINEKNTLRGIKYRTVELLEVLEPQVFESEEEHY